MDIQFGDIWKVGPHLFGCGDLQRGDAEKLMAISGVPDLAYCDPPWNQGLAVNFRRQAGMADRPDWPVVVRAMFKACAHSKGDVYVEMGHQNQRYMEQFGGEVGLGYFQDWIIRYGKSTSCLSMFSRRAMQRVDGPGDIGGIVTPAKWAIERSSKVGDTVFDPCLGLGGTLQACMSTGRRCVGMEINPARLADAVGKAVKRLGTEPEKVGTL